MDFTDPQTLHFSVPIVSVVVLAALVFVCGFRASFEPPSFKALDEDNRKKNRRKNKRITNGFLLSDKVRTSDSEEDRPAQPSKTPSWEQQPKVQDTPDQKDDSGRKEEGNELEEDGTRIKQVLPESGGKHITAGPAIPPYQWYKLRQYTLLKGLRTCKWITQPTKEDRKLQKERRRQQTNNRDLGSPRQLHTRWRDSSFDREASGKVRGKREGQDRDDWGWEVKSNASAPAVFASPAKPRDAIRTPTREDKPRATTINHISIAPWAQKTPVSVTGSTTTTTTTGTDDLDSGIDFSVMTFRDEDLSGTEVQRMEYGWLTTTAGQRGGVAGGEREELHRITYASAQATQGTQVPNHNEWKDIQLDHALLEDWRKRLEKQKDGRKSEASETESQTTEKTIIENGDQQSSEHDSSTEKVLTSSTESQTSSDEFQAQTESRPTKNRSTECQTSETGSKEYETHSVECQVGGNQADEKTEENVKEAVPEKKEHRRKVKNSKKSTMANSSKSQPREASKEAPDVSIQSKKDETPKELLPDKEILHIEDQTETQTQDNEENSGKAKEEVEEMSDNDDTWTVVLKTRGKRVKHIHVVSAAKTNKIVEAETRNEADGGEMLHGTGTNSTSTPTKGNHETKVQAVRLPEPQSELSSQGTIADKQVPKVKTFAMVAAGICTERNADPPPAPPPPPPPAPQPPPMETPSKKPETMTEKVVKKVENKLEPLTLGGSGPLSWADEMEMEESLQTKSPAASPTSTSPPPTTPWGTNAWSQRTPDVTSIETSVMAQQKTKLRTGKGANFLAIDISPDGNWVEDKPVKKKRKPRRDENFAVKTAA
ncbi:stress response protein NST1-like [Branchiostoma floridae]|uniref:Stress response protein NST1-like n=1 Tax=Branchiostoma floridae TaxID=7739 RepID=A0A9J7HHP2_BRAFL|nr:stress response protein NST1-like [Branchiostoma floridae]